jgi:HK97 family phage prohead protease
MNDKLFTKAEIERTEKGMLAVASTAVEDRHGEVVSVTGWDLKNFKKNPILLWGHDHYEPAIGMAKNIRIEGTGKKAKLLFEPMFHDITDKAKALKRLVEEGFINSFSVGFRPLEIDGNTYTSQELLEISLVNVPANPDARMLAYKSLKGAGFGDSVIKEVGAWVESEKG